MGFDELDERGVIHRDVRDVMPSGERRDDHIRHADADLRAEAFRGSDIAGRGSRGGLVSNRNEASSGSYTGSCLRSFLSRMTKHRRITATCASNCHRRVG